MDLLEPTLTPYPWLILLGWTYLLSWLAADSDIFLAPRLGITNWYARYSPSSRFVRFFGYWLHGITTCPNCFGVWAAGVSYIVIVEHSDAWSTGTWIDHGATVGAVMAANRFLWTWRG